MASDQFAAAAISSTADGHTGAEFPGGTLQFGHAPATGSVAQPKGISRALYRPQAPAATARAGGTSPPAWPGDDSQYPRHRRNRSPAPARRDRVV